MPKTLMAPQQQSQGQGASEDVFEISIETFEDEKLDDSIQKSVTKKNREEVYESLEQDTNRSMAVNPINESSDSITPKSSFEKSVCKTERLEPMFEGEEVIQGNDME